MNHHGSESYYVVGEGLLGESGEGRAETLAAALRGGGAGAPFRFSRMGPSVPDASSRRQPAQGRRGDDRGGGGASQIPAGYTYLGQFIDHDLTLRQDERHARRATSRRRSCCRRARRASTSTPSTARADRSGVGEVLRAGPAPSQAGRTAAARGSRQARLRPPAGRRPHGDAEAQGDHPRSAQRREPRGRADAPRVHPLPQPRRRHPPHLGAPGAALRARTRDRHEALPVDAPHRLPAAHLRAGGSSTTCSRTAGRSSRSGAVADRRADDADRVLVAAYPPRAFDDPRHLQLEPASSTTAAATLFLLFTFSAGERDLGGSASAAEQLDRRLPPPLRLQGGRGGTTSRCPAEVQPRDADRHEALNPTAAVVPGFPTALRGQPRVPQPDAGQHGGAGDRPADGHVREGKGVTLTALTKAQIRDGGTAPGSAG